MSAPDYDPKRVDALSPESLEHARAEALEALRDASSLDELAAAKTAHLGGSAPISLANREIGVLPPAARGDAGKRVNEVRGVIEAAFLSARAALEDERDARVLVEERVDVSLLPGTVLPGGRHPLMALQDRIADVFVAMGWEVAEGPEVEHEWFNFDALNMPADHPAREMQDTLWVAPEGSGVVLRTQTSPVQIRSLLARGLPCYVVAPGRVYRNDALDATHSPVFGQVEGLCVDEGITMAHLRGTLAHFAEATIGQGLKTRLRPSYFPFTEPSAELDLQCFNCRGEASRQPCRVCSDEGWIELGGCGMVNPAVLVACGVDPERYSGFAFGMGLDRTLMFRHGITDIRDLYEGDQRFTLALGTEG
ncbi:MAG: phenylalanyl-tRNA synthetase, alpha subunit [Frankiales bacterium]|nr:phenylalanyl-tRNA synthetase, alpha subunit [Frankiales bacterium]